jgi:uncharacterized membrane protein AbrB (regulator of aidB expression)
MFSSAGGIAANSIAYLDETTGIWGSLPGLASM